MTIAANTDDNEDDSYYFNDINILTDPGYLNARDNTYPQFVMELRRDGGAVRIRQTDVAVIIDPEDPAKTYDELLKAVLGLDKEFSEDEELWKFTKRDLRYKLKQNTISTNNLRHQGDGRGRGRLIAMTAIMDRSRQQHKPDSLDIVCFKGHLL